MNPNVIAAYALLCRLRDRGVTHAVLSPGSRSTPLAYVANEIFDTSVVLDERDAGFVALGISESDHSPAVVITTSGSAPTHLYPSVVEAYFSDIPMIIISADRPHEVRGRGAPQTIDQINLFNTHARYFFDTACPHDEPDIRYWNVCADELYKASVGINGVAGPVHLNMGMREPLVPEGDEQDKYDGYIAGKLSKLDNYQFGFSSGNLLRTNQLDTKIIQLIKSSTRPIFTLGRGFEISPTRLKQLLKQNVIVLADVTSNARHQQVITTYDSILHRRDIKQFLPDLVIQLGDALTSKAFNETISNIDTINVRKFDDSIDAYGNANYTYIDSDNTFIHRVLEHIRCDKQHAKNWLSAQNEMTSFIEKFISLHREEEPACYFNIGNTIGSLEIETNILVASSMPIRYAETFWRNSAKSTIYSHRGTNGIDGMLASAYGIGYSNKKPTICVLGDLAFVHNIGFLSQAVQKVQENNMKLTFVVIDNNGGAIFKFLDQAKNVVLKDSYEKIIQVDSKVDIEKLSVTCGANYLRVDSSSISDTINQTVDMTGLNIIHIKFDNDSGSRFMAEYKKQISQL